MSTPHNYTTVVQQQQHPPPRRRRRRHRSTRRRRHHPQHTFFTTEPPLPPPTNGSSSFGVSDSDDRIDSECGSSGIFSYNHSSSRRMESSSSDGDGDDDDYDDEIDLESGELEMKVHFSGRKKEKKICRICHLNFDGGLTVDSDGDDDGGGGGGDDGGGEIELGCNCKGDLGTSHKQCAETWFKIKGNLICEICGATAQNVGADQISEANNMTIEIEPADRSATAPMVVPAEQRTFWQGRRVMNILLGCMVFAFIISWLFHFNVLP
uniref:uncharacterized protein LOC122582549 n=1 Tax=Erigeron canadensis TaxID=72917 RepID=UPI001CB938FC|nr:uncharacterized protein LOC122582549 [Erigeron canadensis]